MENYTGKKIKSNREEIMKRKAFKLISLISYCTVIAILAWQGYELFSDIQRKSTKRFSENITVTVNGNVMRPGKYRVPYGTTNFEILKVAGIRSSSDITPFNLTSQVEGDNEINVASRDESVALKSTARLEFYFGNISIISSIGRERVIQEGLMLNEGDRILTEEQTQAEISLNSFSRVDMDKYSEISFDKIGKDKEDRNVIDLFQKNGLCWYKVSYSDKSEKINVSTPLAKVTISGKGSDFTVDSKYSETVINCIDGLVLVERPDGSDPVNVIAGQSVTIFNDGRPFLITKMSRDLDITRNFSQLVKTKVEIIMRHMPFNFLFLSPPQAYYLVSIQFDKQTIHLVNIPYHTSVSFFVQGVETMNEAYLYGGPVFMSTIVERIMNTKIPKYIVFDKEDILRAASSVGGLNISVDPKAASVMNLKSGRQKLGHEDLFTFMQSSLSGYVDSKRRQEVVLYSLFEQIKSGNIGITTILAEQVTNDAETNIMVSEILTHYKNFMSKKKWKFVTHDLPVIEKKEKNITIYEVDYDEARKLLTEG